MDEARTLSELVEAAARRFGSLTALQDARSGGRTLTFAELGRAMQRGGSRLRAVAPGAGGEAVLLVLEPRAEWFAALASVWQADRVPVPLTHDTPAGFVQSIARATSSRLAIVSEATEDLVSGVAGLSPLRVERLLEADGAPDASRSGEPRGSGESSDLAMLAFTSGSTATPRAVELTHAHLLSNLRGLLEIRQGGPDDAMLSVLPPAHLFALVAGTLAPLACGARVVYPASLLPNRIIETIREAGITHALAVPALAEYLYREVLDQLVETGDAAGEARLGRAAETLEVLRSASEERRSALREAVRRTVGGRFHTLIIGGAAVDPALAEVIVTAGIRVELGYGLTEASPIVAVGVVGECPRRSVGRPLPGVEIRVDERSEILVRGPGVMRGYYRDAAGTAEVLVDGWLRTGDLGEIDADQNLFIRGRLKEAIVTASGRTLAPEDIEPYYAHRDFAEHCVGAIPDSEGNDVATLFVVPASAEVDADRLAAVWGQLQRSVPEALRVSKLVVRGMCLPRTATGKIRRRAVVQQFLQESEQARRE